MLTLTGKHARTKNTRNPIDDGGENEPSLGKLDKHTQKAKAAFNRANSVLQNPDAIDEVKEELNKGGKGRVVFFFIIFLVNVCLGKF